MARRLTRNIKNSTQVLLWGRAAGLCEFAGCNKPLYESSVTKQQVNIGQQAHIWSFSEDGPRGFARPMWTSYLSYYRFSSVLERQRCRIKAGQAVHVTCCS